MLWNENQAAVRQRARFADLIADLAASFVGLPINCIDAAIEGGLHRTVEALGFDHGAFYQSSGQGLTVAHSWQVENFEAISELRQADNLTWLADRLRRTAVIVLSQPEARSGEIWQDDFLLRLGLKSVVLIRVIRGGSLLGAVMLGSSHDEAAWTGDLAPPLQILGAVIAEALARKQNEERLLESDQLSQANLRELSGKMITSLEEERSRIARELHDDVSQRLALMGIEMEEIMQALPGKQNDVRRRLKDLWTRNHETSLEVRRLSHNLHSSKLELLGLVAAVKSLCNELSKHNGLRIRFKHIDVPSSIPTRVALCIYRVVQESLGNVIKHSGAQEAQVTLSGGHDEINLCISDEGAGFDPDTFKAKGGIGLIGIRERLLLIRGEVSIESQPSHGTRIVARIPLRAQGQDTNVLKGVNYRA